jgi:hypothetical protein
MPATPELNRCWICTHALWLLPVWTWTVVCVTSVFMLALLRPEAIGWWLVLMGSLLAVIGICVAMLVDERTRDRGLAAAAAVKGPPATSRKP